MSQRNRILINLVLSAAAGGAIWALAGPRAIWAHAVGNVLGPLPLLGVVFLTGYSVLTLGGAGLGPAFRKTRKSVLVFREFPDCIFERLLAMLLESPGGSR